VVGEVEEGTVSQRVGFQKGDLVLAINGQRLATTRDAERVVRSGTAPWELTVSRGGRVFNTVVGG
jgi:type II secretory pathway component PulC